jgi:phenylacetate-CoA ligase
MLYLYMLKTLFKIYPPSLAFFLSHVPAEKIGRRGAQFALQTLQDTILRVPAYRKFLDRHQVEINSIKTFEDFKTLPLTDKKNYLKKYPLEELCLDGTVIDKYLIDCSSGYGGQRSFWPRLPQEDQGFPMYMEMAYRQFFHIDRKPTLMIITLVLGSWIGGEKISWATRQIAINSKNHLTVMTPGAKLDEVIGIVKQFGHLYQQVVIIGYPPFIKQVIDEGARSGIDWQTLNVKLGLGGEGYSEEWREYIAEKIDLQEGDLMGISGGYGAADLGMSVGREYPLAVLVRKLAYKDEALARDLFGQWKPLPVLCQFNPSSFFIEEIDGELVFTTRPGIPLVRYNIHDRGGVISFNRVLSIVSHHGYKPLQMLSDYGYRKKDVWRLPFFYVWGRSDDSVSIYGAFIYAEDIKAAMDHQDISTWTSGNFAMKSIVDQDQNPLLQIKIELASNTEPDKTLEKKFFEAINHTLEVQNSDYKALREAMPNRDLLQVVLFKYQDPELVDPVRIKHQYTK